MQYNSFIVYLLVFVRIISFLGASPIMMIRGIPNLVKAGFGLILSFIVFNFAPYEAANIPDSIVSLITTAAGECAFGLVLGYIATLFMYAIQMSGQLMDLQIGFAMSSEFNVMSSTNVSIMGNITNLIGLMIFFLIDGHHMLISGLIESFNIVPLLSVHVPQEVSTYVLTIFIKVIVLSLKLAAPVVIVLFITDFTMGLIARTVPQLNVLMMSLPVKVLVGLLAFSAALPGLVHIYVKAFQSMPADIENYFKLFPLLIVFASGEKTEEPTHKKRDEAKKKGQVAKSREFISAITLLGVTLLAIGISSYGLGRIQSYLSVSLRNANKTYLGEGDVMSLLTYSFLEFIQITLPVFLAVMALGVIANVIQTGFINSTEPLKPNLSRLNPIEGFKKMFSGRAYMELLKALANIVIIGYVTYSFLKGEIPKIIKTPDMGLGSLLELPKSIIHSELARVTVIILILGVIDLIYQKRAYTKELRMTKQEVKEEYKQMEGDPQIKSKIRQKQREMAQRRMMHEVPKASVVITNPTHISVALKYEQGKSSAPTVVAKGADEVAQKIKKVAKENDVPIVENKPVARLLYEKVEIGDGIPVEMYQTVAEILALVYSLRGKRK